MSVELSEYKPIKQLQPYVELFWEGHFNTDQQALLTQKVVPNGFVELVIHLSDPHCDLPRDNDWTRSPDYTIIGLFTRPYEVQFRKLVNVFGIRFKPEGIFNLFGVPASLFTERYEDMEQVLGKEFRSYCARLRSTDTIDSKLILSNYYLLNQLEKHHPELTYINRAAEMIRTSDGIDKIDEIPQKVYISLRQLEREFKQKIGLTPKRYMRIARLNDVHRKLDNGQQIEFTKLAFDCGYSDQAHFIRDFKNIMGVKPTIFCKERQQYIVNSTSMNDNSLDDSEAA